MSQAQVTAEVAVPTGQHSFLTTSAMIPLKEWSSGYGN